MKKIEVIYDNIVAEPRPALDYYTAKQSGTINPAKESDAVFSLPSNENEEDYSSLANALEESAAKSKRYSNKDNFHTEDFTPVLNLNTLNPDYIIKVRLTKKYPIRHWDNAKGSGKLMNVEFMDAYGGMIEATMFNEEIDKWDPELVQGTVYVISNAYVKVANQKFSKVKNDYCLSLGVNANVTPCEND